MADDVAGMAASSTAATAAPLAAAAACAEPQRSFLTYCSAESHSVPTSKGHSTSHETATSLQAHRDERACPRHSDHLPPSSPSPSKRPRPGDEATSAELKHPFTHGSRVS